MYKFLKKIPLSRNSKILLYIYFKIIRDALNPFCKNISFCFFRNENKKALIYMSNGYINHGGIVDRTKGILTTFYLSKITNFNFKIYYTSPISYSEIWDSNKINLDNLQLNPFNFKIIYISTLSELEFFSHNKFNPQKGTFLIYCSENILAYMYPNGKWEEKTKDLYDELIILGKNKIENLLNKKNVLISNNLTVIHYRCLNYFNDFEDSNLKPMNQSLIDRVIDIIIMDAKKKYGKTKSSIFISDSRFLLGKLKKEGFNVFSLNPTKHLDNKGHEKEEYLSAYLENYIITKAQFVSSYILYHKEKPFNSHFAYYPSIIGGGTFSKYSLNVTKLEISDGIITK